MAIRILYVITKASWGGAQRYVYDLAVEAKKNGHEVAVAYGEAGELAERLQAVHIGVFPIDGLGRDIRLWGDIAVFFSLLRIIRSYSPQVVHLNSSKIGGIGALAARLLGIRRIIFTAHGWAFNETRPTYQKMAIEFFAWLTVLLSTQTIVVSAAMKRQVRRWPFVSRKLTLILNGTGSYALFEKNEARQALAALNPLLSVSDFERDVWIGTVAELHQVKGFPYALQAIDVLRKKYPAIRYVIAGEGQMRATLETQITKSGLQHNVFLLGQVKEAPLYGRAYDIFLLPSLSEAFAISLLEAGIAALPTVATGVGGIPEIIIHEKTGLLIPSRDSDAIAQALDALLKDAPLRQKLGAALRQYVETHFPIERVVRETFALYNN